MKSFKFGDIVKLNKPHVCKNKVFTVVASDNATALVGHLTNGSVITEHVELLTLKNNECELKVESKEVSVIK